MNALCLREVNGPVGRSFEEQQTDEGIAEKGADGGNSTVQDSIAIAHERSPERPPTTISALRSSRRLVDGIGAARSRVR
jgi:hypothetical protein